MVWDGECTFCRWSIRLLRRVVGDAIDDAPYQKVHSQFPRLGRNRFAESVYFFESDGRLYHGADAIYRALEQSDNRLWHLGRWLYDRFGWFARLSEWVYDWVSRHRHQLTRVIRPLFETE